MFSEEYEVVMTEIVVAKLHNWGESTLKLEVCKRLNYSSTSFSVRVYIQREILVKHAYSSKPRNKQEVEYIWAKYPDFPWTNRPTAEGALAQAKGFIKGWIDNGDSDD